MTIIHCARPVVTSCDIIWHHMLSGHYHNSRKVSTWECLAHVNVVRFVFPLFSVLNSMWLILTIMIVLCASLLTVIYVILCILKAHWLHWICCCSLTADNTHSLLHMVSYRIESYLMHVIVCVCGPLLVWFKGCSGCSLTENWWFGWPYKSYYLNSTCKGEHVSEN